AYDNLAYLEFRRVLFLSGVLVREWRRGHRRRARDGRVHRTVAGDWRLRGRQLAAWRTDARHAALAAARGRQGWRRGIRPRTGGSLCRRPTVAVAGRPGVLVGMDRPRRLGLA